MPYACRSVFKPALALALACGGLAGCAGGDTPQFPPACPALAFLRDAADLSRYAPGGRDLSNLVLQARITAVPASCTWTGNPERVKATLRVTFDLTRGPAAKDRLMTAPYFVAITQGDRVLDEQDYTLSAQFPPNTDHAQFTSDKVDMLIPVTKRMSAAAYQIYVGFRLTPAELEANRARQG